MAEADPTDFAVPSQRTYPTHTLQQPHKLFLGCLPAAWAPGTWHPLFQGPNLENEEADTDSKGAPAFQNVLSAEWGATG